MLRKDAIELLEKHKNEIKHTNKLYNQLQELFGFEGNIQKALDSKDDIHTKFLIDRLSCPDWLMEDWIYPADFGSKRNYKIEVDGRKLKLRNANDLLNIIEFFGKVKFD